LARHRLFRSEENRISEANGITEQQNTECDLRSWQFVAVNGLFPNPQKNCSGSSVLHTRQLFSWGNQMRAVYVSVVVCTLSIALVRVTPASAAAGSPSTPIGTILQATRDKGQIDAVSEGTTIYDGDALTTPGAKTLLVRLGGPQMFLNADSAVVVHGMANGFSASLTSGTVAAFAGKGQTFQLMADGLTVRPFGEAPVVARMTVLNATQIELTSERGVLKVSMGDQTDTIEAGSSYRLEVQLENAPDAAESAAQTRSAGRNRFKKIAIAVIFGAAALILWRALESPTRP
jgi:hypothetical protein